MRRAKTNEQVESSNRLNKQFLQTAGTFAEQLIALEPSEKIITNAFGREVRVSSTASLAYLHGLAVSGIRCAALLEAKDLDKSIQTLQAMARQHVPITIAVTKGAMPMLPELAQTGAIVFQAFNAQNFADRILMAQVIAEKNLLPVVVLAEFETPSAEIEMPARRDLNEFFGDPDNFSNVKSPAQNMVFGNKRKRVPRWLHADLPVHIGAQKNADAQGLETAAKEAFNQKHRQVLIDETAAEFAKMSGRNLLAYKRFGGEKTNYIIVTAAEFLNEVAQNQTAAKNRMAFYQLEQLQPLPNFTAENLKNAAWLAVIESYSATQNGWLFKEFAANAQFSAFKKQHGFYAETPTQNAWAAIIENAAHGEKALQAFWVDVAFDAHKSAFPKHQVLVQQIAREYPELQSKSLIKERAKSTDGVLQNKSLAVKKYAEKGPAYTRVSRFFDDTACFYGTGANEIIADPFQEIPVMPMATANFLPLKRGWAPEFIPQNCQDIEAILKACPHGAMPASLLTIDAIIKAGIQQARNNGNPIGALVPLLKIWAKNASDIALKDSKKITTMGDFLPAAFEQTLVAAKADAEKTATLKQEYAWTMESISDVPIAFTDKYFAQTEKAKAGTGEVFTLGVDPSSCIGCGTCAELCTDASVKMNTDIATIEALNAKRFAQFANLPSTADATVNALIADKDFDSFAALMLNGDLYSAFVGGTKGDDFSAEKSIIRMISALAKYTLQPNSSELEKTLSKKNAELNAAVKKILSDSLPVTHLDSLMEVLQESGDEKLSMERIMNAWGQQDAFKVVEKGDLQSKLEIMEALKEWKWALKEGFTGVGRANYTVVVDQSLRNFSQYPWNNFTVPVILAEAGTTADLALGAFEGHLRHALDQIKLLRRADLEAIGKYDASVHDFQIAGLSWAVLTEEEKKMVPPVLVLANQQILAELSSPRISEMLDSGYPIKLFILDNVNPKPENAAAKIVASTNAMWSLLAAKSAQISRVSLTDAEHMFAEMQAVLNSLSGAVVSVLCPNTFAHDINPQRWRALSNLGVNARAFSPFSFNPMAAGKSFGSKFNTAAIPNFNEDWQEVTMNYTDKEEEASLKYKATFADWAFTLLSWKQQFKQVENVQNTLVLADYLALAAEERAKKVPIVLRVNSENNLVKYEVGQEVIASTEAVLRGFRLLREMAGLFTEYPMQLRENVLAELSGQFETEKKKLAAELAKEKAGWEAENLVKIKEQVKQRLMQMAQEQ